MAKVVLQNMMFISSKQVGAGYKLFILADEKVDKFTFLGNSDIPDDFKLMEHVDAFLNLTQDVESKDVVINGKQRKVRQEVSKLFLENLKKSEE